MNSFSQFNIKPTVKGFDGDKIKMCKVLNKQIIIHDFNLSDSKVFTKGTAKCLQLQISVNDTKYIIFTSAKGLIETIQQIKKTDFPFSTTIIQENERFNFS